MESYYDTLGVSPTADAAQLRRAYRHAVRKTHPDTGGTSEAFHAVQVAWNTLSDPARRSRYDARNHRSDPIDTGPAREQPPAAAATSEAEPQRRATTSQPRRSLSSLWSAAALAAVFATTGSLTWLILADLGRVFAVAAGLYLAATAGLAIAVWTGTSAAERPLTLLLRGAWILGAGFIALGLVSWASDRSPWAGLVWGACVLAFAGSTKLLLEVVRHR